MEVLDNSPREILYTVTAQVLSYDTGASFRIPIHKWVEPWQKTLLIMPDYPEHNKS